SVSADKREFRLIVLKPSCMGDVPSIYISPSSGRTTPGYTAISYCWGEPSTEHFSHPLRTTLYHSLQDCRHATLPTVLWIDAICIIQTDI
ncbi:hypothetical protein K491DRAFT_591848, partial [Lophiostoma macrostomum CBS 122681]